MTEVGEKLVLVLHSMQMGFWSSDLRLWDRQSWAAIRAIGKEPVSDAVYWSLGL